MPMSLFKNNKNRNKVVNPYCSLGWLLIITIFQKCAKLKPPWVHLGKQNNTIIFVLLFIFLTKKWTSAVCGGGGVRAHPSHPPPYGPVFYSEVSFAVTVVVCYNPIFPSGVRSLKLLSSQNVNVIQHTLTNHRKYRVEWSRVKISIVSFSTRASFPALGAGGLVLSLVLIGLLLTSFLFVVSGQNDYFGLYAIIV